MAISIKRFLVGRAKRTEQAIHERLSKKTGLAVFASDALSSTAYASEEILLVLAVAAPAPQSELINAQRRAPFQRRSNRNQCAIPSKTLGLGIRVCLSAWLSKTSLLGRAKEPYTFMDFRSAVYDQSPLPSLFFSLNSNSVVRSVTLGISSRRLSCKSFDVPAASGISSGGCSRRLPDSS